MILGASEIRRRVEDGKLIEDYIEKSLGGAGYDMRAGRLYTPESGGFLGVSERKTHDVKEITADKYTLSPGEYILVETVEKVNMPDDVMARILPRSSLFRTGCSLITAVVDPGFKGTLTMGLKNMSSHNFTLEKNARIAQIVFEKVEGETILYDGKYQGGKVV